MPEVMWRGGLGELALDSFFDFINSQASPEVTAESVRG